MGNANHSDAGVFQEDLKGYLKDALQFDGCTTASPGKEIEDGDLVTALGHLGTGLVLSQPWDRGKGL